MNEERVVADGLFTGHRHASGMGKLTVGAHHKALEGVGGVQTGALDATLQRLSFKRGFTLTLAGLVLSIDVQLRLHGVAGRVGEGDLDLMHILANLTHRKGQLG